jgi:hypothetical protein
MIDQNINSTFSSKPTYLTAEKNDKAYKMIEEGDEDEYEQDDFD